MIPAYTYIHDIFTAILSKSRSIQGRVFTLANGGSELNSDDMATVIKDLVMPGQVKKYPLAAYKPPRSQGVFTAKEGDWEKFQIEMFFLKTTFYAGDNKVQTPNKNTNTSNHPILYDWQDMHRTAVAFFRVLDSFSKPPNTLSRTFQLPHVNKQIEPVSFTGADRVSGVKTNFLVQLYVPCLIDEDDYAREDVLSITLPVLDSHPEHKM